MKMRICLILLYTFLILLVGCDPTGSNPDNVSGNINDNTTCTFMVASDMRGYAGSSSKFDSSKYFRGACEESKEYNPDFVIFAGDQDPIEKVTWTVDTYLGVQSVFTIGNHDAEDSDNITEMGAANRTFNPPGSSNKKYFSSTTFSFDFQNCHFLITDQYEESSTENPKPKISSAMLSWIDQDLQKSSKSFKFVVGHVPYENAPDTDTGTTRSYGLRNEIPEKAERFWNILKANNATAYFCGHTHLYSHNQYDNVWQINAGVALVDTVTDTEDNFGSFVVIEVTENQVTLRSWRAFTGKFELTHTIDITN